jgi:hypothetical protein
MKKNVVFYVFLIIGTCSQTNFERIKKAFSSEDYTMQEFVRYNFIVAFRMCSYRPSLQAFIGPYMLHIVRAHAGRLTVRRVHLLEDSLL